MSSLCGIIGVLLALVSSGHSLSCTVCRSDTSDYCTGPSTTCPAGSVCGTVLGKSSTGAVNYIRAGTSENGCNMTGSTTIKGGAYVRMVAACCSSDNCTPILPTSHSLSCTVCRSDTSDYCTGPSTTCPAGSVCGTVLGKSSTGAVNYIRACTSENGCNMTGSTTIKGGAYVRMVAACCSSDNCTPILPTIPGGSSVTNGVICRSCVSADSTWCYTSDTMACTGDENMCLLLTTKYSGAQKLSTAVRGCTTKSICDFGSQSFSANGVIMEYKYICTDGGLRNRKGFFLQIVISIVLLKTF
ncbi:phospholipase A2 inhibitor and Ly6/PLAUR domain-containing protein-like isoform X2 [Hyperolius riggenbachi]|uniref:phospholipase A2 inhibitor and Ly6/PLAUR domain-containing protein-like isoform X2 n=1 Tax=Hyperolius riggenbachi TaxID=752182 RepID=UPI0035A352BC